jgi:hypothetical protein
MSREDKHAFYRSAYEAHLETLSRLHEDFHPDQGSPSEQRDLSAHAANLLEKQTELTAFGKQVEYGANTYDSFEQWYTEGYSADVGPGGNRWQKFFDAAAQAVDEVYQDDSTPRLRAEAEYRKERERLFGFMKEKTTGFLRGEESERWGTRQAEEAKRLEDVRQKIHQIEQAIGQQAISLR